MKKPHLHILVLVTCVFTAFLFGFFTGRNSGRTPVQIQTISSPTESFSDAQSEPQASSEPVIIDLNTASSEQLQTLPGIGPVLAGRIIEYRDEHGDFRSIGELAKVSGIGEKKLEALWDLVTVGG